jgi:hypothetical protein
MNDFETELRREAQDAIAAAREATLRARRSHARAELMRHMILTTAKSADRPRKESVALVTDEWLDAWRRDRGNYPFVAQMEALAGACYDALRAPGPATDVAVRSTFATLEAACEARRTTLADEMAWRSGCSHGWWGDVRPAPASAEYRDLARRADALWERGCAPECLG